MQVITLLNEKGGVGKTTSATVIASGLAIRGARVVLIDGDAQANSTSQLRIAEEGGLYRLLVHDAQWGDVLRRAPVEAYGINPAGELLVLPSNLETRVIPMLVDDATLLKERVEELDGWADYVVIDTSPTPSMLHSMIYVATQFVMYPTQCEMLALEGLAKSIQHMEKLNNNRRMIGLGDAVLLGIQPMMYDVRTNAHDYGLSLLLSEFKRKAFPAMPMRTVWRDAGFSKKTIFAHSPDNVAATEAWAMVDRVVKGMAS